MTISTISIRFTFASSPIKTIYEPPSCQNMSVHKHRHAHHLNWMEIVLTIEIRMYLSLSRSLCLLLKMFAFVIPDFPLSIDTNYIFNVDELILIDMPAWMNSTSIQTENKKGSQTTNFKLVDLFTVLTPYKTVNRNKFSVCVCVQLKSTLAAWNQNSKVKRMEKEKKMNKNFTKRISKLKCDSRMACTHTLLNSHLSKHIHTH